MEGGIHRNASLGVAVSIVKDMTAGCPAGGEFNPQHAWIVPALVEVPLRKPVRKTIVRIRVRVEPDPRGPAQESLPAKAKLFRGAQGRFRREVKDLVSCVGVPVKLIGIIRHGPAVHCLDPLRVQVGRDASPSFHDLPAVGFRCPEEETGGPFLGYIDIEIRSWPRHFFFFPGDRVMILLREVPMEGNRFRRNNGRPLRIEGGRLLPEDDVLIQIDFPVPLFVAAPAFELVAVVRNVIRGGSPSEDCVKKHYFKRFSDIFFLLVIPNSPTVWIQSDTIIHRA